MRKYCLAAMSFLLLMCLTPALMAQSTSTTTKEANIRKLLVLIDASGTFKRAVEIQMTGVKKTLPQIPPKFWDEVLKEVDPDKLMDLIVPIYDKHFTNDEIMGLIAFYETPLGKKMVSSLPQVMAESAAAGGKYGEQIAIKVIQRMQAEGTFPSETPAENEKPKPPRR